MRFLASKKNIQNLLYATLFLLPLHPYVFYVTLLPFPFFLPLPEKERSEDADDHDGIGPEEIRIFQCRIHAAPKERKSLGIDPALRRHISCHACHIRILDEAIGGHADGSCQEGIERLLLFPHGGNKRKDQKVDRGIHQWLEGPVHE